MFNFLYRKNRDVVTLPENPTLGLYHQVFTRQQMPSPGAENMAYRSLALAPMTPIGYGVQTDDTIDATQKPAVAVQSVATNGIPTQAGTMRLYPLFDPSTGGYMEGFSGIDNIPYRHHDIQPAGGMR